MAETHPPGLDFEIVVQLTLGGSPVAGLDNSDFPLGSATFQLINPSAASGAPVNLTGGAEFEVEELQVGKGTGTYALKFDGSVIPTEGDYSIVLANPGIFDALSGVVRSAVPPDLAEALSLLGKNVVGIPSGYDANGQVTGMTVFFFASAADAETYIDDYTADPFGIVSPASSALVIGTLEEAATYAPDTSLLQAFIRKVQ